MESITTRDKLIENVENSLAVEKLARDRYLDESVIIQDKRIRSILIKIKEDEDRHIELLENLIKALKK